MNELIRDKAKSITSNVCFGSYKEEDCTFLLKNLNGLLKEQNNEEREKMIQSGTHYSEMLPIEYIPTKEYVQLFHKGLKESAKDIATYVGLVSELILKRKGKNVILVSLARAGTPIGILIRRYIKFRYGIDAPHYSISIIRGKGIDENALCYMIDKHKSNNIQFIDGWTGKGMINNVLEEACEKFGNKYGVELDKELAVLADPSKCVKIFGTREDFLIPSACLNSTVSGLMSRTVLKDTLIKDTDFHGAKYYERFKDDDVSNYYIDYIASKFEKIDDKILEEHFDLYNSLKTTGVINQGIKEIKGIQQDFDISNINMIKPGVGETTRVLLRRIPWKILVDDLENPNLKHVIMLAQNRKVPVEVYKKMTYSCCGIIKVYDQ